MKWIQILLCLSIIILSCVEAQLENCAETDPEKCEKVKKEQGKGTKSNIEPKTPFLGYPWERTTEYWTDLGHQHVMDKIRRKPNKNKAKNVVFFIGDGMSIPTLFATRVAMGGEETELSFEKFPYTGLSKTYCVDSQVAESACSGTAYMTGVKGNYNTLGVNGQVPYGDCQAANDPSTHVDSITKWALDAGLSAGLVTTTRVTHASPAAGYAHVSNRNWENDFEVREGGCNPKETLDIAQQLIYGPVGSRLSVILGGGRGQFRDAKFPDEEGGYGYRNDSRDLISEWLHYGQSKRRYVWNREGLLNLPSSTDKVLGLFEKSHLQYYLETQELETQATEPTLEEMTRTAINILSKNKKGFFLFVEGGKIDLAHHELMARAAIGETIEFQKAIQTARKMLSEEDSLIVVSSDHSHTMTVSGYPVSRKNWGSSKHGDIINSACHFCKA